MIALAGAVADAAAGGRCRGRARWRRSGPCLTYQPRGPLLPISGPKGLFVPPRYPVSDRGSIPSTPFQPPEK